VGWALGEKGHEPVPDDFFPAFGLDVGLHREGRAARAEELGESIQFRLLILLRRRGVGKEAEFSVLGFHVLNHAGGSLRRANPGHAADDSVGGVARAERIFIPDAILDDHDGGGGADGGREGIRDDVVEFQCFVGADDVGVG